MNHPYRLVLFLVLGGWAVAGCDGPGTGPGARLFKLPGAPDEDVQLYSVLLMKVEGPRHVAIAKRFQRETIEQTGWKNVFVVHQDQRSLIYWDKYRSIEAAEGNLRKAKAFRSKAGLRPFTQAITIPLPGKPVGPPQWDILKTKGVYTVMVAVFQDVPEADYVGRKKFAVQYCRQLRDEGWEAYYHHGPSHSAVMIGSYDTSVVKTVTEPGHPPQKVIKDVQVKRVLKTFPKLAVNGREEIIKVTDPKTGKTAAMAQKSKLIYIPGRKPKVTPRRPAPMPPPAPPGPGIYP